MCSCTYTLFPTRPFTRCTSLLAGLTQTSLHFCSLCWVPNFTAFLQLILGSREVSLCVPSPRVDQERHGSLRIIAASSLALWVMQRPVLLFPHCAAGSPELAVPDNSPQLIRLWVLCFTKAPRTEYLQPFTLAPIFLKMRGRPTANHYGSSLISVLYYNANRVIF